MKKLATILSILVAARVAIAGESALTTTYQPLDGLGSGVITVVQVTCHHWYAMSSVGSAIDLIDIRNVPPTDNPTQATQDLNLASRCGLQLSTNDLGALEAIPMIFLDATKFDDSKAGGYPKEDIVRASLECLRRCLPEKLKATKITLSCRDADKEWLSKIVSEFDAAPRDSPFYEPK
jgi:hypothetical protein